MKKKLDKLKEYLKMNKKVFIFLFVLFIVALVAGSIFSVTLNDNDTALVNTYLENYINSINDNTINFKDTFINSISSNLIITIIIWLLGISVIGLPIIIFLFFYKCFVIGFAISSILMKYKVKGLLLSIFYVFPHHIINILLTMILISYAFIISIKIIGAVIKRKEMSFRDITYKYLVILGLTCLVLVFSSLYEAFIVPKLIKLIMPLIS
jgi:stage II sporulation protein M